MQNGPTTPGLCLEMKARAARHSRWLVLPHYRLAFLLLLFLKFLQKICLLEATKWTLLPLYLGVSWKLQFLIYLLCEQQSSARKSTRGGIFKCKNFPPRFAIERFLWPIWTRKFCSKTTTDELHLKRSVKLASDFTWSRPASPGAGFGWPSAGRLS